MEIKEWLKTFFQNPNQWDLQKIKNASYRQPLSELLQQLIMPAELGVFPFFLPLLVDKNNKNQLWFYLIAKDDEQFAELNAIINAYFGKTYLKVNPVICKESKYPLEETLLKSFPNGFIRIAIQPVINDDKPRIYKILSSLNQLIVQYQQRPMILSTVKRPVGRILRDFFTAYNNNNYEAASNYYQELKQHQLLSKRNLISIELQSLASGYRWKTFLQHPELPLLLTGRIPRRIYQLSFQAIINVSIDLDAFYTQSVQNISNDLNPWINLFHNFFYSNIINKFSRIL